MVEGLRARRTASLEKGEITLMNRRVGSRLLCAGIALLLGLSACSKTPEAVEEITINVASPTPEAPPVEDLEIQAAGEAEIEDLATPVPTPPPVPVPPEGELGKIGYISIDNTKVDYPIVVAEDNEYYLNKDPDGKRNYRGSIFMDFRNVDPQERRNIVLYGHNNKDQSMFSTLHKFERESFFNENTEIDVELYGVKYRYEIVYTGMVDFREYNHIRTKFSQEESFLQYYHEGLEKAQFAREGYTPQPGDQMLTLSTCVSHSIKDYDYKRLIVVARMQEILGIGEHSEPPASFGPVEASELLKALPERQMFLLNQANDARDAEIGTEKADNDDGVIVIPPGE